MSQRPLHRVAQAVSAAAAGGTDRCRAHGRAVGQPRKPLWLRANRRHTHDRGPSASCHYLQRPRPSSNDRRVAGRGKSGRVRIAIGRASDFFGAGVTESTLGARVFGNAIADKRADFIGNPDLPHTYSYVPDIAAGLAVLGTDERAVGLVWHIPGPETVTTRTVLELIAREVGHPVPVRAVPKLVLRTLGLVNPLMRGLAEMAYEFEEPFVLDTTKYESTFGAAGTPLDVAIKETVTWYQSQRSQS